MKMSLNYHIEDNEQTEVGIFQLSDKTLSINISGVTYFCTREQAFQLTSRLLKALVDLKEPIETKVEPSDTPF